MGVLDSASVFACGFVCVSQWRCPWKSALDCGRKRATACAIAGGSTAVDVPGCLLPGEGMAMAVWLGASGEGGLTASLALEVVEAVEAGDVEKVADGGSDRGGP